MNLLRRKEDWVGGQRKRKCVARNYNGHSFTLCLYIPLNQSITPSLRKQSTDPIIILVYTNDVCNAFIPLLMFDVPTM